MKPLSSIFDTQGDTKKYIVPFKTRYVPHNYIDKNGLSMLYLHISSKGTRKRIPLDLHISKKDFNAKKQRVNGKQKKDTDLNLILDNIDSKITAIKTTYRLSHIRLDTETFVEEFLNGIPRIDFIAFCFHQLELQKSQLAPGTYRRYFSFLTKLRNFKSPLLFTEMNTNTLLKIRKWLAKRGNQKTTIESNMAAIKKFLNAAKKAGILLPIDPINIKVGNSHGNRVDLIQSEVKRLFEYYSSGFINDKDKLVLGYFLFGCFSGLRISEVQALNREQFEDDFFVFFEPKNNRLMRRRINKSMRTILDQNNKLFVKKLSNEFINREIKKIVSFCGITKKISFHNSRHTFATNFLRSGGDIISLQQLLGHRDVNMTMIYTHIVEAEVNDKVFLIDKLLD